MVSVGSTLFSEIAESSYDSVDMSKVVCAWQIRSICSAVLTQCANLMDRQNYQEVHLTVSGTISTDRWHGN